MAGDLIQDSDVRIVWAATGLVLVDFDTGMWELPQLDGERVVEIASRVRADGIVAIPRELEEHVLRFAVARETASGAASINQRMTNAMSLPRGAGDVLIEVRGFATYRLKNCAVRSWRNSSIEHLTDEGVEIIGGRLVVESGGYVPGQTWGEIALNWEDLG